MANDCLASLAGCAERGCSGSTYGLEELQPAHHDEQREERLSASVSELAAEEEKAKKLLESAAWKRGEKIEKAREKAQKILEEARAEAQEKKAGVVKEAEEKTLAECKQIVAEAEKQAAKLSASASKNAPAAGRELEKYFYKLVLRE